MNFILLGIALLIGIPLFMFVYKELNDFFRRY